MTQSLEDYLEAIYILCLDKKVARIKDISEKLAVSKPSVIQAIKELKNENLLIQEPYGYIELTSSGLEKAKQILKKHNILKKFLEEILGVSTENAEKDACKIEHIISEETFTKIIKFMRKK
ncbi:MAG: metal-dependent transcriptional regulator [Brevinematales bacterium]|nr:metal-dependent transcriptional regulator [Brevinematales bacterium]